MLKTRKTVSGDVNPAGAISSKHPHTPKAQGRLISLEDLRLMIFKISGIFQNGRTIAATKPTFSIKPMSYPFYNDINFTSSFNRRWTFDKVNSAVLDIPKPSTLKEASVVA